MAMISLKNLVAPVSNSVHLVSIAVVVMAFGVWRYSGGQVNFVRPTRSSNTQHTAGRDGSVPARDNLPRVDQQRPTQSKGSISVPEEAADDLLGSILSNNPERGAAARKNQGAAREKSNSNSLEDIERSLGIK